MPAAANQIDALRLRPETLRRREPGPGRLLQRLRRMGRMRREGGRRRVCGPRGGIRGIRLPGGTVRMWCLCGRRTRQVEPGQPLEGHRVATAARRRLRPRRWHWPRWLWL
ncbi:hypothetical protein [Actinomadura sp. HBU206391]|uniref:hypothetical protein n=1 Tax=Actinomadura sp. HBU206391 TaxID=2731692 RepID=UPI00165001B7|nr:hypothetical protein [Actinomadura sp. HBU206391]